MLYSQVTCYLTIWFISCDNIGPCVCVPMYVFSFSNSTFEWQCSHFVLFGFCVPNCLCIVFSFLFCNRRKLLRHIFLFWNDFAVLFSVSIKLTSHFVLQKKETMNRINGIVKHTNKLCTMHPSHRDNPVICRTMHTTPFVISNSVFNPNLNASDYRLVAGARDWSGGSCQRFIRAPLNASMLKQKATQPTI